MKHIKEYKEFLNESTIEDFIKDIKNHDDILSSGAYEKDGEIVVYLDGSDPDAEEKAINKLVRTKYKDKLKKVNDGSEDSITFKVLKESTTIKNEDINEATEQFKAVDIPKSAVAGIERMINTIGVNQAIRDVLGFDNVYQSTVSVNKNNIIISITQKTRKGK